ncbi:SH3 domain-containing protein [Methylocystis sp. ATCC 49242]|uniref:SH3 domain-containing protein n=1 Tax=Methylocystis sp. ATCC 49242 TaxID=622637 RepID=UPI0001F86D33|nr:SH3 domain-containing protein [Methylocystis sp. ATCC 49242]
MSFKQMTLLAAAAAFFAATAGEADAHSLVSPATVRSGPGIQWPAIAKIPAGVDVNVSGCYSGWQGGWCAVQWKKVKGYVQVGALAPSGANDVIVAPIVTIDNVNLRKGPGTNWPSLAVVPSGEKVDVAYCSQGWLYGWCKISYEGQTGFVNGLVLRRQNAPYATTFY